MSIIVKLIAVAVLYMFLSIILKSYQGEFLFLLRMFTVILLFSLIVDDVSEFVETCLRELSVFNINSEHIALILKVIAIAILCDFVSDTLKDVGENAIANIVIISSKFVILLTAFPLFKCIALFCLEFVR